MGMPISERLLAAGHELVVHDVSPDAVARAVAAGAHAAVAPEAASAEPAIPPAEVTITSLPTPAAVEQVLLGEGGVLDRASPGAIVIDTSTSSPALARRMAEIGERRDVAVLDAPVSGGPGGAQAGTLAIMVGGDRRAFARASGVLGAFGSVVRHMGPAGAGQATKLTNNLLAATHMAVLGEAVAFARREGLDPAAVYEVVSSGTGDSRVLRNRFPVAGVLDHAPASNEWAPLFPVELLIKDVGLAVQAAAEYGLELPLAALALERYEAAREAGFGQLDYSAVARLFGDPDE
jgi:3-hydroxyisobutyrate dehydrogenase